MRRLNVRPAQIDECIQKSMFAISYRPQNPALQPGELLLLQLVKDEARRQRKEHERVNFALVFDHLERDYDGTISRLHWPHENRVWEWIIYGSATVPTIPFSLEDLALSRSYDGQTNPQYIEPADADMIHPYIQWTLAESPAPHLQLVTPAQVVRLFGARRTLAAIYNHDRIAILRPVPKRVVTGEQFVRNEWLAENLKSYYECQCQVCGQSFQPVYGVDYAETHHIHYLSQGGPDISTNVIVVCPNHHRVIHAANAQFDRQNLAYEYPNGLREPLVRPDHFVQSPKPGIQAS